MVSVILLTGRAEALTGTRHLSAISKRPVPAPVTITAEGILGDEQADLRVHGGRDKALHHYPLDHYSAWRKDLGDTDILQTPGAFGENLSTRDLLEEHVAVGDIFRLGTARVQVSQGRQPCWKLNHRFDMPDMARRVQDCGRTGWYCRVLEPGTAGPEDDLTLIDRVAPDWSIRRLWQVMYVDRMNLDALREMASLDVLAEGWKRYARRRLDSGRIEDWRKRLEGTT